MQRGIAEDCRITCILGKKRDCHKRPHRWKQQFDCWCYGPKTPRILLTGSSVSTSGWDMTYDIIQMLAHGCVREIAKKVNLIIDELTDKSQLSILTSVKMLCFSALRRQAQCHKQDWIVYLSCILNKMKLTIWTVMLLLNNFLPKMWSAKTCSESSRNKLERNYVAFLHAFNWSGECDYAEQMFKQMFIIQRYYFVSRYYMDLTVHTFTHCVTVAMMCTWMQKLLFQSCLLSHWWFFWS